MTTIYPDIASYQEGMPLDGVPMIVVKATEGTSYINPDYQRVIADAARLGIWAIPYHYLNGELPAEQADHCTRVIGVGRTVMLDVEDKPSRAGVEAALAFARALRTNGANPRLAYLPRWYWEYLGSPDLRPLEAAGLYLVSSNYPITGYSDTGPGWAPYGGVEPLVWQFTNAGPVNGYNVDLNAYRGTVAQLRATLEGDPMSPLDDANFAAHFYALIFRVAALTNGAPQLPDVPELTEALRNTPVPIVQTIDAIAANAAAAADAKTELLAAISRVGTTSVTVDPAGLIAALKADQAALVTFADAIAGSLLDHIIALAAGAHQAVSPPAAAAAVPADVRASS